MLFDRKLKLATTGRSSQRALVLVALLFVLIFAIRAEILFTGQKYLRSDEVVFALSYGI